MHAYIGLGSNLANPRAQVEHAFVDLAALPSSTLLSRSSLYSSKAVGPGEQPDYVNAVAMLETELTPLALLEALQEIEQSHRRVRAEHWGPRTLDLDILLLDRLTINSERLKVPHPYLTQRNFVLYPLADIAPELHLPNGQSLQELIALCPRDGLTQIE
jgi:2-amino-4-hydroxy-6-hydroxymethyldihydropteridine diphosphokinase